MFDGTVINDVDKNPEDGLRLEFGRSDVGVPFLLASTITVALYAV